MSEAERVCQQQETAVWLDLSFAVGSIDFRALIALDVTPDDQLGAHLIRPFDNHVGQSRGTILLTDLVMLALRLTREISF